MSNVENKEAVLEDLTLEETFELLEKKLKLLESGDISLEDSFKIYKDGMGLLQQCHKKIDYVEKKVLEINEAGDLVEFRTED